MSETETDTRDEHTTLTDAIRRLVNAAAAVESGHEAKASAEAAATVAHLRTHLQTDESES